MKNSKLNLNLQIFFLTVFLSALLSFFSVSCVLCISFHLTKASVQSTLEQNVQFMLNHLAQTYREEKDDALFLPNNLQAILPGSSQKRIVLYENGTLIYDSFPTQSNTRSNQNTEILSSECTLEINHLTYRMEAFQDIYPLLHNTMALLYLSLPVCFALSICLGFIASGFSSILKNGLIETTQFLNCVSEDSYPPPLIPCGSKELDDLFDASNRLSKEIKNSLANYKDAIDAFIHEIKTPLTAIMGYSEMLQQSDTISNKDRDSVEYITTESQRLNMLTRKIIYFLSVDKQKIQWSPLDIDTMVESAILSTRSRARIKNISIEYKSIADAYLYGDEELFITCIVNILENAIKASPYGSKIFIHIETELNAVSCLSIQDFGKGIPKNELTKIFQPFYMLHKSSGGLDNGLGLGLAICSSIANAHHCRISVSSEPGFGTTVALHLPVAEYQQIHGREHPDTSKDSTLYIPPSQP